MIKLPKLTLPSLFTAELFSDTSLSQVTQVTKSIEKNLIMQNKPNFMRFYALNRDYEEKQTQTNPIQTQNKANSSPSATPQSQNKPNQTQSNPISKRAKRNWLKAKWLL